MKKREMGYFPINSYGIIGDLHTIALVNPEGGIDWSCFPIFDSPSMFGAILDKNKGGSFYLNLASKNTSKQFYLHGTNILITQFLADQQSIEIIDYMPIGTKDGSRSSGNQGLICRHVECTKGVGVRVNIAFSPRPDYGRITPKVTYSDHGAVLESGEKLLSSHKITWEENGNGYILLDHGDSVRIVFSINPDFLCSAASLQKWTDNLLLNTRQYWESWLSKCNYKGRWRRMVERSALVLKLLAFKPTGAILAAPTASLPEGIGGIRNWDYRFSWLRDSALTLNALFLLGFSEEAEAFQKWVVSKYDKDIETIPILYSISDVDTTEEKNLDHLEGYMKSAPVRIGNAASDQLQLDVYGEIIDCFYMYSIYGGELSAAAWNYVSDMAERICRDWMRKDEGVWEVRGGSRHFTYSKFMCWVGLDRAMRIGRDNKLSGNFELWESTANSIYSFVMENCVSKDGGFFTQSTDDDSLDASNLLISIHSFVSPDHPAVHKTLDETLKRITKEKMVYRYLGEDGLEGHEGAFNICTFWLVEALALSNRTEEASDIFNSMLEHSNSLGLYAEEIDPATNISLGNYPQAFTHVGLINAALILNNMKDEERPA